MKNKLEKIKKFKNTKYEFKEDNLIKTWKKINTIENNKYTPYKSCTHKKNNIIKIKKHVK